MRERERERIECKYKDISWFGQFSSLHLFPYRSDEISPLLIQHQYMRSSLSLEQSLLLTTTKDPTATLSNREKTLQQSTIDTHGTIH